jgi:hypothetical protein
MADCPLHFFFWVRWQKSNRPKVFSHSSTALSCRILLKTKSNAKPRYDYPYPFSILLGSKNDAKYLAAHAPVDFPIK